MHVIVSTGLTCASTVKDIVTALVRHPSLGHLDLSRNPISHAAGKMLSHFAVDSQALHTVLLEETLINPALIRIIQKKAASKLEGTSGSASTLSCLGIFGQLGGIFTRCRLYGGSTQSKALCVCVCVCCVVCVCVSPLLLQCCFVCVWVCYRIKLRKSYIIRSNPSRHRDSPLVGTSLYAHAEKCQIARKYVGSVLVGHQSGQPGFVAADSVPAAAAAPLPVAASELPREPVAVAAPPHVPEKPARVRPVPVPASDPTVYQAPWDPEPRTPTSAAAPPEERNEVTMFAWKEFMAHTGSITVWLRGGPRGGWGEGRATAPDVRLHWGGGGDQGALRRAMERRMVWAV